MNDFLRFILHLLREGAVFAAAAGLLCAAALAGAYALYRARGGRRFPWRRAVLLLLLAGYLAMLLYATLLRLGSGYAGVNLHLFRAWREAWNSWYLQGWLNVLLNVALFVPLGVLLPLLAEPLRRWYLLLPAGFGLSLLIEAAQYGTGRGLFDVDDLFNNTLGALLGLCLLMACLRLWGRGERSPKKALTWMACPLLFAAALAGIFACYHWREYGNLPGAPSFPADTGGVDWTADCRLDDDTASAAVYSTEPLTRASCDAFAADFAARAGVEFDDTAYYNDTAVYMNHTTGDFLSVSYPDRTYQYRAGGNSEDQGTEADEAALRAMLAPYGVEIPAGAVLQYEGDGVHTFTADMLWDGSRLADGVLRCRVRGGRLDRLEAGIATFQRCREEAVLTQAQAFDALRAGTFSGGEYFEYLSPARASVLSCRLDYAIDTKGFYQPVWLFALSLDGEDWQTMVPALK